MAEGYLQLPAVLPTTETVYDHLGFKLEADEIEEFKRASARWPQRNERMKQRWDAIFRKMKWSYVPSVSPTPSTSSSLSSSQHSSSSSSSSAMVISGSVLPTRADMLAVDEYRYLVYKGVPQQYRAGVWATLSGARELQRQQPAGYYASLLRKAVTEWNSLPASDEIERDLLRTFPGHSRFNKHKTQLGIDPLRRILLAYSIRNKETGYCQSMNVLTAWLLLTMPTEEDAFWMLCAVVEVCCPKYYTPTMSGCQVDMRVFSALLKESCVEVFNHFERASLSLPLATTRWFLCLFVNIFPSETTLRIWDMFFLHGSMILFRASVAILRLASPQLLQIPWDATPQLIKALGLFPRKMHDHRDLFREVRNLVTISHKKINQLHTDFALEIKTEMEEIQKSRDIKHLLRQTSFTKDHLLKLWAKAGGGDTMLNFSQFQDLVLQIIPSLQTTDDDSSVAGAGEERGEAPVLREIFNLFDQDHDKCLNFREMVLGLSLVSADSLEEKLKVLFKIFDRDQTNTLSRTECQELLTAVYKATSISPPVEAVKDVVDAMFHNLTNDGIKSNGGSGATSQIDDDELTLDNFLQVVHLEPFFAQCLALNSNFDLGEDDHNTTAPSTTTAAEGNSSSIKLAEAPEMTPPPPSYNQNETLSRQSMIVRKVSDLLDVTSLNKQQHQQGTTASPLSSQPVGIFTTDSIPEPPPSSSSTHSSTVSSSSRGRRQSSKASNENSWSKASYPPRPAPPSPHTSMGALLQQPLLSFEQEEIGPMTSMSNIPHVTKQHGGGDGEEGEEFRDGDDAPDPNYQWYNNLLHCPSITLDLIHRLFSKCCCCF